MTPGNSRILNLFEGTEEGRVIRSDRQMTTPEAARPEEQNPAYEGRPTFSSSCFSVKMRGAESGRRQGGGALEPRGEMRGVTKAQGISDLFHRQTIRHERRFRMIKPPPLQPSLRSETKARSKQITRAAFTESRLLGERDQPQRLIQRPIVQSPEQTLESWVFGALRPRRLNTEPLQSTEVNAKPLTKRALVRAPSSKRPHGRRAGFLEGNLPPATMHSAEERTRGFAQSLRIGTGHRDIQSVLEERSPPGHQAAQSHRKQARTGREPLAAVARRGKETLAWPDSDDSTCDLHTSQTTIHPKPTRRNRDFARPNLSTRHIAIIHPEPLELKALPDGAWNRKLSHAVLD